MRKFFAWLIISYSAIAAAHSQAGELRVAVAANFVPALTLIKQQFEKEYKDRIVLIKGSTGKLYAQIKHGAPYDVYLAADIERPRLLEQDAMTVQGSRYTYAIGQLALWSPKNRDALSMLRSGNFNKLAIANPKIAPYGKAAVEVMERLNVYAAVKSKLVFGENVAQAMQFVQAGSADLGFVPLSLIKPLSSSYWLPAADSYQPIEQQLVILRSSGNLTLATTFAKFIRRDDIKALIRAQGYDTL